MAVVTYRQKEDKRTMAGAIAPDEFVEGIFTSEELGLCRPDRGTLSICLRGWGQEGVLDGGR
jgi:hypothetical protein